MRVEVSSNYQRAVLGLRRDRCEKFQSLSVREKTHLRFQTNVAFVEVNLQQYKWRFVALCFVRMATLNLKVHTLKVIAHWPLNQCKKLLVLCLVQYTASKRNT